MTPVPVAVLVSGGGTNLQALLDALRDSPVARIARVVASGVALTGATVHYVDEEYDRGPIIAQWPVPVRPDDTPDTLATRVLEVEHRLLPQVVVALARLGVPERPVRLSSKGSGFVTGDKFGIDLDTAADGRTGGRADR